MTPQEKLNQVDQTFVGIPWKDGGLDRSGCDCRGLAALWLKECKGLELNVPKGQHTAGEVLHHAPERRAGDLERGDLVFFSNWRRREVCHVAVYLGEGRYLHILRGRSSWIQNGVTLFQRCGLMPVGTISWRDAERVCNALSDPKLGDAVTIVLLVVSIALSLASALIAPKLPRQGNKAGRYSDNPTATQTSPEIPLPDLLGKVVTAGNAVYTQIPDRSSATSASSKWNKIVVLGSAPFEEIDYEDSLFINGLIYNSTQWKNGTYLDGFAINPTQNKDEAVTGSISSDTNVPSISIYDGAHDISVPVDIRAQYDRTFPIYGLSGCAYLVFRLIDATKFSSFNVTCRIKGRKCRTFDSSGFIVTTASGESLTGADGSKVRFKLAYDDVVAVSSLTVNGTSYSEISASNQSGNVFKINALKGYIEFVTAPAAAATITVTYTYHPREWTQNPASQIVYLLTEKGRGKGFGEERIDWPSAVALRDYCDEGILTEGIYGQGVGVRYRSDYAVDFRKPIQEHLKALLDACYSYLFVSGGKFTLKPRRSGSSVFSFDTTNILRDSFQSTLADRAERPNRVKVLYHSEDSFNAETEIIRDDLDDQASRSTRLGNDGIVDINLKFPAVTSSEHAARLGDLFLTEQVNSRRGVTFKTSIRGLPLEPGDLIDVTHPAEPGWAAKLFRIEELAYDEEDRLEIRATEYSSAAFS